MIRRHPLLILLVVATFVVDLTLVTIFVGPLEVTKRAAFSGLVFGQTGALAIWAVWGTGHRLARVSLMVVATCGMAIATGSRTLLNTPQWLAILCAYTLIVYLGTLILASARAYTASCKEGESGPTWQVSLIELFGWTILVAIASFASRSMDFTFLSRNSYLAVRIAALVTLPLFLAAGIRTTLDKVISSTLFIVAFIVLIPAVIYVLRILEPHTAEGVVIGQSCYLLVWALVIGLDGRMCDMVAIKRLPAEEAAPAENDSGQLDT